MLVYEEHRTSTVHLKMENLKIDLRIRFIGFDEFPHIFFLVLLRLDWVVVSCPTLPIHLILFVRKPVNQNWVHFSLTPSLTLINHVYDPSAPLCTPILSHNPLSLLIYLWSSISHCSPVQKDLPANIISTKHSLYCGLSNAKTELWNHDTEQRTQNFN